MVGYSSLSNPGVIDDSIRSFITFARVATMSTLTFERGVGRRVFMHTDPVSRSRTCNAKVVLGNGSL